MTDEGKHRRAKKNAVQIGDLDVQEISSVDVPANGREFALVKSADDAKATPATPASTTSTDAPASLAPVFMAGVDDRAPAPAKDSLTPEQRALMAKFSK